MASSEWAAAGGGRDDAGSSALACAAVEYREMAIVIRPASDLASVQRMVAAHWTPNHPVGRPDDPMARFYLMTPWVDRTVFPAGISVLMAMRGTECLGLSCVQVTPTDAWHVIWTMTRAARGLGVGRQLLMAIREAVQPKPL